MSKLKRYFTIRPYGKAQRMRFVQTKYRQGGMAIELVEPSGEEWMILTVNLEYRPPGQEQFGTFWAKSWGENFETYTALKEAGLIEEMGVVLPTGYAEAKLCRLTFEGKKYLTNAEEEEE